MDMIHIIIISLESLTFSIGSILSQLKQIVKN